MKKLLCNIPSAADSTSFYRAFGPLNALRRKLPNLVSFKEEMWNWATIGNSDGVFMQRPFTDVQLQAAVMVKNQNKPLWIDLDDDLFCVPIENVTHKIYSPPEVHQRIIAMLKLADVVTVCSEIFKAKLEKLGIKNVVNIPNCFDLEQFPYTEVSPRRKIITWRGSQTHHKDVMVYAEQVIKVANDPLNKDWHWKFLGDSLWFITENLPSGRVSWQEEIDVIRYHKLIKDMAPTAFWVALHDSEFNRNKSNIAWLEATHAGAACLAPDWPQWAFDGPIHYSNKGTFGLHLEKILAHELPTTGYVNRSRETITQKFNLVKWNETRASIICELMKCTMKQLGGE